MNSASGKRRLQNRLRSSRRLPLSVRRQPCLNAPCRQPVESGKLNLLAKYLLARPKHVRSVHKFVNHRLRNRRILPERNVGPMGIRRRKSPDTLANGLLRAVPRSTNAPDLRQKRKWVSVWLSAGVSADRLSKGYLPVFLTLKQPSVVSELVSQ